MAGARKKQAVKRTRTNGASARPTAAGGLDGRQQRSLESHLKKINTAFTTIGTSMQAIRSLPLTWSEGFMPSFAGTGATGRAKPTKQTGRARREPAEQLAMTG